MVGAAAGLILLIVIIVVVICKCRKRRRSSANAATHFQLSDEQSLNFSDIDVSGDEFGYDTGDNFEL